MTVIDASVAIKWFIDEPSSQLAREVLAADEPLTAPAHLSIEVGRGLLRSKRAGNLNAADALLALAGLPAIVALIPTERLAAPAFEIADQASITIYDALYVALAEQIDDVLITADQRLCDGVARSRWAGRAQHLGDRAIERGLEPEA